MMSCFLCLRCKKVNNSLLKKKRTGKMLSIIFWKARSSFPLCSAGQSNQIVQQVQKDVQSVKAMIDPFGFSANGVTEVHVLLYNSTIPKGFRQKGKSLGVLTKQILSYSFACNNLVFLTLRCAKRTGYELLLKYKNVKLSVILSVRP